MRNIHSHTLHLSLLAAIAAAPLACSSNPSVEAKNTESLSTTQSSALQTASAAAPPSDDVLEVAKGNTQFAFDLYKSIARDDRSNTFYSPYSVSIALAMTYAGAVGETAQQIAKTLHVSLPVPRANEAFNALAHEISTRGAATPITEGQRFQLNVANSLWQEQSVLLRESFLNAIQTEFGAEVRKADFAQTPELARGEINRWVAAETSDKVKDLLPPSSITPATRFVLANAIYFSASWELAFSPARTHTGPFARLDGSRVPADLMNSTSDLKYFETPSYQAVEIPYVGKQTSMVVVLPPPGKFKDFERELNADIIASMFSGLATARVTLSLPKFVVSGGTISLRTTLSDLGMTDAFSPSADFSAMIAPSQGTFSLSDVYHQAYVRVDESGTEAAASTASAGLTAWLPTAIKVVNVDRPFIFMIRDVPTNTTLFVGKVVDPRQ